MNINNDIYMFTFFCVMITAEFSPLTATAVLPPPVAAFMAYSI